MIIFISYLMDNIILASFTEGQSETIVEDIENMVRSYVEKVFPLSI